MRYNLPFLLVILWQCQWIWVCQGFQGLARTEVRFSAALFSLNPSKSSSINEKQLSEVEDDGFTLGRKESFITKGWNKLFRKKPGTLILVRHGETAMNYNSTFTGWIDTDLSERGRLEMEHAARLLLERGYDVDTIYTSRLKRAIRSSWILLIGLNQIYKPVFKSWRLNERMYGALEGLSKQSIALEMGEEVVQQFRTGLYGRPPPMPENHPHWHMKERKYSDLSAEELPLGESLQDTMERTTPLWESRILPDLVKGKNVMIVAHANSLRGIVKLIEGFTPEDIRKVQIPNGIPIVYKFDSKLKPIRSSVTADNTITPISGEFLEKSGSLKAALDKEVRLTENLPAFDQGAVWSTNDVGASFKIPSLLSGNISIFASVDGNSTLDVDDAAVAATLMSVKSSPYIPSIRTQFDPILTGLRRLNVERELMRTALLNTSDAGVLKRAALATAVVASGNDTNKLGVEVTLPSEAKHVTTSETPIADETDLSAFATIAPVLDKITDSGNINTSEIPSLPLQVVAAAAQAAPSTTIDATVEPNTPVPTATVVSEQPVSDTPQMIVIIRHGKTEYNKLGIFTGSFPAH